MSTAAVSVFEYDCEAVRVVARRVNSRSGAEETRKFSVDPNLTSFDILKTILSRAFEIQGDFAIAYEAPPAPSSSEGEWLPLLSDWDLDTAIISAAEPFLNLVVTERTFKTLADLEEQERLTLSPEVAAVGQGGGATVEDGSAEGDGREASSPMPTSPREMRRKGSAPLLPAAAGSGGGATSLKQFYSFRHQIEKSLVPSLANRFQRAKTLAEETWQTRGPQLFTLLDGLGEADSGPGDPADIGFDRAALTEKDLKLFLNKVGEVVSPREMRLAVYQRGVAQHVRKVVWKHLLGAYPSGLDGRERVKYIKRKCDEYEDLKKTWVDMVLHGKVTDDLKCVTHMVKKDVLRTDRHHPFYSGEGNANVTLLYNILTTYALHHPSVGYCQVLIFNAT